MRAIADFHIHSRFSRATSRDLNLDTLSEGAKLKGISILGTGDFTHPDWLKELKTGLGTSQTGIYEYNGVNFVLSSEVSSIFETGGKVRKVHILLLAENFEVVDQINERLEKLGRLESDGRPILSGVNCSELAELLMEISPNIAIICAHYLTPWFGVMGSKSGFDSIEECFQEQTKHVSALETGLSSDPLMAYRISKLDKFSLVSFSDAHSPSKLGREFTVFDLDKLTYGSILDAMKNRDGSKIAMTGEFFPEEGKYYWDGHRNCNVSLAPKNTIKLNDVCPRCRRKLTIGVLHRIEELADRPEGFEPKGAVPFKHMIPLVEIIGKMVKSNAYSKKALGEYYKIVKAFGNELNALLNVPREELLKVTDKRIADAIIKVRNGKIVYRPGSDGVYGCPIFDENDTESDGNGNFIYQKSLTDF